MAFQMLNYNSQHSPIMLAGTPGRFSTATFGGPVVLYPLLGPMLSYFRQDAGSFTNSVLECV